MMAVRSKSLLFAVLMLVATPWTALAGDLESVYAAILRGDYDAGRQAVSQLATAEPDNLSVTRVKDWLADFDQVLDARKDVKQRTLDWSIGQVQQALAGGKTYLALTFAAKGAAYSLDKPPYGDAQWVEGLVKQAMAEAETQTTANKWSNALAYYTLASRLRPEDKDLKTLAEDAIRHARIELLYKDEEEMQRRVDGVDYTMLRRAARSIDHEFFKTPDFKEISLNGVKSVLTLCETGKLQEYLDGLANPATREHFVDQIKALRANVEAREKFDYIDFIRLYTDIKDLSEKSVEMPEGLLIIEFLEGALGKLDDFSSMVWPADLPEFNKMMMGDFEGVGIQLAVDEYTKRLKVDTPLPDAPAIKAGIQAGDLIIKVDGVDTTGWTTEDAVRNITGPAGSDVVLTMFRPSTGKYIAFTVTRQTIELKTVRGVSRLDDGRSQDWNYILDADAGVAMIRLTGFHPKSAIELQDAMATAERQGMKGLILDLRANPGGLLDVAIDIVSMFVSKGDVVSTSGQREPPARYPVSGRPTYADLPLIVLVNDASASASEIFAGAMQDHNRAIVVGERTFGKGSVQRVFPIVPNARLKLTTALYYLPSGRTPNREPDAEDWGVTPDCVVELNPKELVRVIEMKNESYIIKAPASQQAEDDAAKETRQATLDELTDSTKDDEDRLLSDDDIELLNSDPIKVADNDPQLETALLLMRVKLAANLPWPRDIAAVPMDALER